MVLDEEPTKNGLRASETFLFKRYGHFEFCGKGHALTTLNPAKVGEMARSHDVKSSESWEKGLLSRR